jgi:metallo-beta-lactamase class B
VNPGYQLLSNRQYPQIATDYETTVRVLASLPCDIFLGAHGAYYDMDAKLHQLRAGGRNPFIDPEGYRAYVNERERAFRAALSAQQQSAK